MNKGFIATLNIVFRRSVSLLNFSKIFMSRVRLELMSSLNFRLEAKSFVVIEI